jgi:hypothetical protein
LPADLLCLVLKIPGAEFIGDPEGFQTEIFGNGGLFVVCDDESQVRENLRSEISIMRAACVPAEIATKENRGALFPVVGTFVD